MSQRRSARSPALRHSSRSPKKPQSPPPPLRYDIGDAVYALWRGSRRYYPATIAGKDAAQGSYEVDFDAGGTDWIPAAQVYKRAQRSKKKTVADAAQSPKATSPKTTSSRSRKTTPGRSPGRPRSRSRSRSRSVTRRTPKRRTPEKAAATAKAAALSSDEEDGVTTKRKARPSRISMRSRARKDDQMATPLETMTATLEANLVAPKTTEYKFGGPIGATISYFVLPLIAYFVYFACRRDACDLTQIASSIRVPRDVNEWISVESLGVVVGFMLLQALLYCIPAGKAVSGSILRDGTRLKYRMNGLFCLIVSVGVFGALWYYRQPVTFVYDHFLEMITAFSIVAFVLSVVAHLMSLRRGVMLSEYGNSGNFLYDFFMGRALNPRIASVLDIKMLVFGRFMMIGLVLVNLSMLAKQYETDGKVSLPMVLVCTMQFLYVLDGLLFEEDLLSINEISKQGVGFFICYSSLVLGPILYSLQARFLVDNPVELSQMQIATILILEVVGYVIFRWSNTQKNSYRRKPDSESSKRLKVLKTARGTNLIISGLWGFVRHPNYLGDLMMNLALCLCTGVGHFMPYLTFVFLVFLLIDRAKQDDADCRKKYKLDWDTYCNIVRYKIVPYIF